ncbi:MAG: glycosyltransferase, partial [Deltaproteobacteria bacterium]|nr:glycosyltransferase [Deltaproteobacteria bacterium]
GVEGKKVLLTFGLLSPNKGIEYMIKALPEVIKQHPDVTYIILGATHPHVLRVNGEEYRISLQQLAQNLKVSEHVIFQNRFVELKELCEFLGAADLYITPYVEEAQIVSGALIYAMGTGKATISTPYWYASEMLSDERGRIVPFENPDALAEQVIDLFDNDVARHTIRKNAYTFCREAIWKEVARKYLQVFTEVRHERSRYPHLIHFSKTPEPVTTFELPELKLDHLKILTDETGVLQHATHTIPDRTHGYCTDDNARALLVSTMASQFSPSDENLLYSLSNCYLSFLQYAFNEETGRFRNFMTYSRQWTEDQGSEDSHGRALWGLGMAVAYLEDPGQLAMITTLLDKVIKPFENARDSRALAFSLVGIHAYLRRFSGDSEVK